MSEGYAGDEGLMVCYKRSRVCSVKTCILEFPLG